MKASLKIHSLPQPSGKHNELGEKGTGITFSHHPPTRTQKFFTYEPFLALSHIFLGRKERNQEKLRI
jgi:hypothetical protein